MQAGEAKGQESLWHSDEEYGAQTWGISAGRSQKRVLQWMRGCRFDFEISPGQVQHALICLFTCVQQRASLGSHSAAIAS